MKKKINADFIGGVLIALLSVVSWYYSSQIKEVMPDSTSVGAAFFPKAVSVLLLILAVILIIQSLLKKENDRYIEIIIPSEVRTVIFLAIILLGIVLIDIIGFLISSIITSIGILLYLGCKKKSYYLICSTASVLIYMGFTFGLKIQLPTLL